MNTACVTSVVGWLKASEPDCEDLTVARLFRISHFALHGTSINEETLLGDLILFAKGKVPLYVLWFLHKNVYPKLVHVNDNPKPVIIY